MSDTPDAELLATCHSDPDAFAVFYRRYERLVAGWLVRQCRRPDLAAELTAEVFAAAYLAAPRFRPGPEPAGAWLLGIARNLLLRSLRRDRADSSARRRLGVERLELSDASLEALQSLAGQPALDLLQELPADQRDAVRARVIEELDYEEMASRAHVTETVVRKRVSRGLAALRRRMDQPGGTR